MRNNPSTTDDTNWFTICAITDLPVNAGCCALVGDKQIAIFYLPDSEPSLFATQNYDPIGHANVLARGILGDLNGTEVVASPLYKQHFNLRTGECLEDADANIEVFPIRINADTVQIRV